MYIKVMSLDLASFNDCFASPVVFAHFSLHICKYGNMIQHH